MQVFKRRHVNVLFAFAAAVALSATATAPVRAQGVGKYLAPKYQVVAIRAGRLFDSRWGTMLFNQVVLIRGDRMQGPAYALPILQ